MENFISFCIGSPEYCLQSQWLRVNRKNKSTQSETEINDSWRIACGVGRRTFSQFAATLVSFFDVEGTTLINSSIVFIAFLLVIFVYYYINRKNRKNLYQTINLNEYSMVRIWIRPDSLKYALFVFLTYSFFFGFTLLMWGGFIQVAANVLILIFGMLFLFIALFVGLLAIGVGDFNVKIKDDEKIAI